MEKEQINKRDEGGNKKPKREWKSLRKRKMNLKIERKMIENEVKLIRRRQIK